MGKVVVLASGDDADAAKNALGSAGLDFEVVDPTASNLLHIVIGMVDESEDTSGNEEPSPEEEVQEPAPEETEEEPAPEEEVQESLGTVLVNDEPVQAVRTSKNHTVLQIASKDLMVGPKTTFTIAESVFSFWNSADVPSTLVKILLDKNPVLHHVQIKEGSSTVLRIGTDLLNSLK